MQVAKDREAVFEVGLEFKITRTVDVSVFIVIAVLIVASGTDRIARYKGRYGRCRSYK